MFKQYRFLGFFLSAVMVGNPAITFADVYKLIKSDGGVRYTDKPVSGKKYQRIVRSEKKKKAVSGWLASRQKRFDPIIRKAAKKHQVDARLLHAVIRAESAYNPKAVSKVGAVGLMQLMPATAKRFGVKNRRDPHQNIDGGARYLRFLLKLFKSNTKLALAAYNAGEGAVKKYGNRIPPYRETTNYVVKVMDYYRNSTI